jgi:radical SAM protein with 4Fe4S-binding SPASM domain
MCDLESRHNGHELSSGELKRIIDDLASIGTSGIGLTGGEPLLRDDIFELIRHVKQHGLPVTVSTNGLLLNRDDIRHSLVSAEPTNINISLDGATPHLHDSLRGGRGLFEKTVAGARLLASELKASGASTRLTAVTVISSENTGELEAIAELADDIGFHRIGFMPLHDIDSNSCRAKAAPELADISSRIRAISRPQLENSLKYLDTLDQAFAGRPFPVRCNAGLTSIFVDPHGKIAPCLGFFQMGKWSGNLLQGDTLKNLWSSDAYTGVRRKTALCRQCYLNCQAELSLLWPRILS